MSSTISPVNNTNTGSVTQNKNAVKRKKSKAPVIGAIVGAGVGASTGIVSGFKNKSEIYSIMNSFYNYKLSKVEFADIMLRRGVGLGTIVAGIGAGIGAIVSLFTRKSREKAECEENKTQTSSATKNNNNVIKRKKSKAPKICAIIAGSLGTMSFALDYLSCKSMKVDLVKLVGGKASFIRGAITNIAADVAMGAGVGAIVSLFTRKAREKAAIKENNALQNT